MLLSWRRSINLAQEKDAKIVDLRFIDVPGWQHFSIPVGELSVELFEEGIGFDGSSIRGFQTIDESDMLLFPDPTTAVMDPYTAVPTMVLICNVKDPITGDSYSRDPRYVAQKAEAYVKRPRLIMLSLLVILATHLLISDPTWRPILSWAKDRPPVWMLGFSACHGSSLQLFLHLRFGFEALLFEVLH